MSNIEFLTVINYQGYIPQIENLIARFQKENHIPVEPHFIGWDTLWRELVNVGIYQRGADIMEVGTTWVESLVAMNALRPFTSTEIDHLGGKSAFLPATWRAASISGDSQIWGIPIRCDVRVIWYWKDMLEDAKVDAAIAFKNPQTTQNTLEKLKSVVPTPWLVTTALDDPNIIQSLATWIWAYKTDFVTPDCKKVLLMEPAALDALRAYFGLYRYMPKDTLDWKSDDLTNLFVERKAAALFGGPWVLTDLRDRGIPKKELARIGIARTPGPPFVGGTVLTARKQVRNVQQGIELIRFLTKPDVQVEYCPPLGLLPTTHKAWETPSMQKDPFNQGIYQAFENGRGLPAVPLWGMVEEKLKAGIYQIWKDLLQGSQKDVDKAIHAHLEPIVNRLNISIQ